MDSPLGTVIIYARDMQKAAAFYARYFGFLTDGEVVDGLIELKHPAGGAGMLIHQAAKSVKLGQVVEADGHVLGTIPPQPEFARSAFQQIAGMRSSIPSTGRRLRSTESIGCGEGHPPE
ncbi:VOC family protein [Variovorax sp. DXTD-1]|uniref:VOC family protein n=1 Tax=Variovorax sp. DXTD-1 TaxID=2495592 RepID=UPI0021AEE049|nr:hypothetical protein [Variovorax sp. DXTD-1]